MSRLNAVTLSHKIVQKIVRPGDVVVDATVGNGRDTVFLAELVGSQGKVIGFDIQQEAIGRAIARLAEAGLEQRVTLIHDGHENLTNYVKPFIKACMFNLGYLPGSSHDLVTRPETTGLALQGVLGLLDNGGIITLVVYTGHPGGCREAAVVDEIACSLPQEEWDVMLLTFPNRKNNPPYLVTIQRR